MAATTYDMQLGAVLSLCFAISACNNNEQFETTARSGGERPQRPPVAAQKVEATATQEQYSVVPPPRPQVPVSVPNDEHGGIHVLRAQPEQAAPSSAITSGLSWSASPGVGASLREWKTAHPSAPEFNEGTTYGPVFREPSDGSLVPAYHSVGVVNGRIWEFGQNLAQKVPMADALAIVRGQLPTDAKLVRVIKAEQCRLFLFKSRGLQQFWRSQIDQKSAREFGFGTGLLAARLSTYPGGLFNARTVTTIDFYWYVPDVADCG
jgi:hypothetical protein